MLNGFDVWGIDGLTSDETGEIREVTVATNETVNLYCGAASKYSEAVVWLGANLDSEGSSDTLVSLGSSSFIFSLCRKYHV